MVTPCTRVCFGGPKTCASVPVRVQYGGIARIATRLSGTALRRPPSWCPSENSPPSPHESLRSPASQRVTPLTTQNETDRLPEVLKGAILIARQLFRSDGATGLDSLATRPENSVQRFGTTSKHTRPTGTPKAVVCDGASDLHRIAR